jgi:5'-deoxynucleotidase YfbR-like HD superfamily hydrolase
MEQTLRTLFRQLSSQYRWEGRDYLKKTETKLRTFLRKLFESMLNKYLSVRIVHVNRETIAEHMFKQNFITQMMLAMELHAGNPHGIDPYRILACCNTHDYGEGPVGDVSLSEKTQAHEDSEAAAFDTLMDQLVPPELRSYFPQPLDRSAPEGDINSEFWKACEKVGYLVYASYAVNTNATFQEVIDTHLPELLQSKFTSVLWMLRRIGLNHD